MSVKKLSLAMMLGFSMSTAAFAEGTITADYSGSRVNWELPSGYSAAEVHVGGPSSFHEVFTDGETPAFEVSMEEGEDRPDGLYSWQVTALPDELAEDKASVAEARATGDHKRFSALQNKLQGWDYAYVTNSGQFMISDGAIAEYDEEKAQAEAEAKAAEERLAQADNDEETTQ